MFHRLIGALLALLVSGFVWSAPCAPGLPERLIPEAGKEGTAFFASETIKDEYQNPAWMARQKFDRLVGMWNAVTVYPCDRGRPATIEFHSFEIVRLDKTTGRLVPELTLVFDGSTGSSFDDISQWKRAPEWWVNGRADREPSVVSVKSGVFRVDLKSVPDNIVHMWTSRIAAKAGEIYGIRAKVRIAGDARLQVAMDYWKGFESPEGRPWKPACEGMANCEAWLGDWYGDTGGKFVTVVSPRSLLGKSY